MVQRVVELKIQENHLSNAKREALEMTFVQGKWVRNFTIHAPDPFTVKLNGWVEVMMFNPATKKCDIPQNRQLTVLGAQLVQSVISQVGTDIVNLSKSKKKGRKVGGLRNVREMGMIPLKQYGKTHELNDKKDHVGCRA